jgi:PDZ domain-containing protein
VLLTAALIAAATIRVPYYAIKPGSTRAVGQYVTVPADRRVEPSGQVLFVTVNVEGRLTFLGRLIAERDGNVDVVPEELITGGKSRTDYRAETVQEMVDSQMKAAVVALHTLCFPVKEQGTGARISLVTEGSPSSGRLRQGDVVVGVNGRPVAVADDLIAAIRAARPGDNATVEIEPPEVGASRRTETIQLGRHPDDQNRAFLGVSFATRQQKFDLPFPVTFDTGRVGGPSAGLAFAITVLDLLTEGELTGGKKIAVTGTIELDGTVGPVGGVEQKAITVGREHATLFLVPASELDVARSAAGPGVKVLPVATIGDAVQALAANGGDTSKIPNTCPT